MLLCFVQIRRTLHQDFLITPSLSGVDVSVTGIVNVQSEMLTNHLVTRHPRLSSAQDRASVPATRVTFDVKEGDSSTTFAAAVPGLFKADIKVARPFWLVRVAASQRPYFRSFLQASTLSLASESQLRLLSHACRSR